MKRQDIYTVVKFKVQLESKYDQARRLPFVKRTSVRSDSIVNKSNFNVLPLNEYKSLECRQAVYSVSSGRWNRHTNRAIYL